MSVRPEKASNGRPPAAGWGKAMGWIALGLAGLVGLACAILPAGGVPTPACVEPVLTLGAAKYRIQPVARAADGSVPAPGDAADVAYWVDDTVVNYLFTLSPAPSNLALRDALHAGDEATITWADCVSDTFRVETVQTGLPDLAALTDQSSGGLTAIVRGPSAEGGLVIRALRPLPPTPEAPAAEETPGISADMAFGEMTASPDGKSLVMSVTITNTGAVPLALSTDDISLTPQGGQPLPPASVEPALPQELAPGAGITLQITFPKPGGNVALLRILDVTFDRYF